jgi:hypothetical protein
MAVPFARDIPPPAPEVDTSLADEHRNRLIRIHQLEQITSLSAEQRAELSSLLGHPPAPPTGLHALRAWAANTHTLRRH